MTPQEVETTIQSIMTLAVGGLAVEGIVNPAFNAGEVGKIVSLAVNLEPAAADLINKIVGAFYSGKTPADKMKAIDDIVSSLAPMEPKP